MLVFFMDLGFASVESGLCRAKNTVTILAKNFVVFAASSIAFLVLGWGLMFGDGNPFFGTAGLWFVSGADNSPAMGEAYKGVYSSINWTGVPLWTKFFFQLVFAGTAATIVSGRGCRADQVRRFLHFQFSMVAMIYPVMGHWIWGGGWAAKLGMFDFAGSTVVHSVGGWAALTGHHCSRAAHREIQQRRKSPCRSPATVSRWRRSAFSCSGLVGLDLILAARWPLMPALSDASLWRLILRRPRRQSPPRSRHGCFWASLI